MKVSSEFRLPLSVLREEMARSDLLPPAYAQYRPLLADGLRFFLERLSSERLRRNIAQQLELPPSVSIEERVALLLCQSPVLHKLGQMLARDRRLGSEFRKRLQRLESLEPQTPQEEVMRQLEAELGNWRELGIKLGRRTLAEGSVALVMPFELNDRPGVLKLLRPHVTHYLNEDLEILSALGDFVDEDCSRYHLPQLDYKDTFETIRHLLQQEVRLEKEQNHMENARKNYSTVNSVIIPKLFPFCTPRMTAMERVEGEKMPNWKGRQALRDTVARTTIEALVAQPIFSSQEAAIFHADPHAGNLLVTPEGKVAILDWSLVGYLKKRDRVQLTQLILGALEFNAGKMGRAVEELSLKTVNQTALREVLRESLSELRWGTPPGLNWLTTFMDRLTLEAGGRFDHNILLFRKTLLTLEGVLTDLGCGDQARQRVLLDQTIMASFLAHWAVEWPSRFSIPLTSRSLDTHISTADALSLAFSGPTTLAHWWSNASLDVLRAMRRGHHVSK